jgi:hypothetical protein
VREGTFAQRHALRRRQRDDKSKFNFNEMTNRSSSLSTTRNDAPSAEQPE